MEYLTRLHVVSLLGMLFTIIKYKYVAFARDGGMRRL